MQSSTRLGRFVVGVAVAALLLAGVGLASVQPAQVDGATQPQPAGDLPLPERVVLPDSEASGSAVVGPSVAASMDRSGSRLDGAYNRYLLEERLSSTDVASEQRSILNRSVTGIESTLEQLRERERSARRTYRNGEIDTGEYLATLQSVNARATQLEELAYQIAPPPTEQDDGLAGQYDATTAANRISALRGSIVAFQSPVRSALGRATSGESDPNRFYVTTARNETVLAVVAENGYLREANRDDLLVRGSERGLSLNDAYDLAIDELYPEFVSQYGFDGFTAIAPRQTYQARGDYDFGTLQSYIDANSENVFWEYQRMDLDQDLPTASPVSNASGNVTVAVHPTYEIGPARVVVTENGDPLSNVSVSVDGHAVAETDADGRAWVVLPPDAPVVTANTSSGTVDVRIEWGPDGATNAGFVTS